MATTAAPVTSRLKQLYKDQYVKELQKELGLDNVHQVPLLEKIVVNVGLGKAKDDKKVMEVATNTLRKITGQQPVETTARMSIASFKLRGKRVFLMAPIHHHYEKKGWSESTVVIRFWILPLSWRSSASQL